MGYPTSVFNPAVRSNGQTIDAAHVNDLQTEVTALETALLGTITHSVNVTGASTFAVRPVTPPPDAVRVFLQSTAAVGSSAASTLVWESQSYLTNSSLHSTAANPERLTPQSTGIYQVTAQITVAGAASATNTVQIAIDDSSNESIARHNDAASTNPSVTYRATGYKRFDVLGGYVKLRWASGGLSTHSLSSGTENTWFAMHKL